LVLRLQFGEETPGGAFTIGKPPDFIGQFFLGGRDLLGQLFVYIMKDKREQAIINWFPKNKFHNIL